MKNLYTSNLCILYLLVMQDIDLFVALIIVDLSPVEFSPVTPRQM